MGFSKQKLLVDKELLQRATMVDKELLQRTTRLEI